MQAKKYRQENKISANSIFADKNIVCRYFADII